MNFILAIIRLVRLPNLIIVFLTQLVPYWCVLRPAILKSGGIPALNEKTFGLLALTTVMTTLTGYVLNDYYDRDIDAINKPNRVIWGKYLPSSIGLGLYAILLTIVHFLAFLLDYDLKPANRWPLWVFPGVSFLLFLYAWQLKCTPLIGNLLVSILCGVVPIIVIFPEERPIWLSSFQRPDTMQSAVGLVWLYGLFAFVTNLLREQIKDLEDFTGDSACGCTTLAVVRGPRYAKKPAGFTGIAAMALTLFLMYYWQSTQAPLWQLASGALLLLLPALLATILVFHAKSKRDYTRASALVKLVMLAGIFLLIRP